MCVTRPVFALAFFSVAVTEIALIPSPIALYMILEPIAWNVNVAPSLFKVCAVLRVILFFSTPLIKTLGSTFVMNGVPDKLGPLTKTMPGTISVVESTRSVALELVVPSSVVVFITL